MLKLFTNAVIQTMASPEDKAIGMLCEDGIIRTIYRDDIPQLPEAEIVDLQGAFVYPGFIDTHTHSFEGGLYSQAINLLQATSIEDVLTAINDFYTSIKGSDVNMLFAFRFDENKIAEKRFPTPHELNRVCPDKPLLLRRIDGHSCVINLVAREMYLVAHPFANKYDLEREDILRGEENDTVVHWFHSNCSEELILRAYHQAAEIAAANGHTAIHTMIGDAAQSITHYKLVAQNLKQFAVEYMLYPQSFNIEAALDVGASRIGGCILADGSLGSHTAALSRPYHSAPLAFGTLYQSDEYWYRFIADATRHRLQVAVHCIGDRAIRQINNIYLRLYKEQPHDLRHEIIHCELTPDDLVNEIAASQAVCVMQPAFDLYWGAKDGFYEKTLGMPRYREMNRFRTLTQKGIMVTGGSDWYITEVDALQGIRAAVRHNNPEERLAAYEAVKLYTSNAAWLSHDEKRLGTLEAGKQASFVCLDADLMQDEGLNNAKVKATYRKALRIYQV